MKKADKLSVEFAQRAGSRLRAHEKHWKLRRYFEPHTVRVRIDTKMPDLHTLFAGYSLVVTIGETSQELRLRDVLSWEPKTHLSELARLNSAEVRVALKANAYQRLEAHRLIPRSNEGRGFRITIEVEGYRLLWQEEKNASAKDSNRAARSRRPIRSTK